MRRAPRAALRPRLDLLALLAALLFAAWPSFAAPSFPSLTGRVVDNADILSPEAEAALTAKLEGLEVRTGRQVVIATVADLQGHEIDAYGLQLAQTWGVGRRDFNDGVLFLIAPAAGKVRIEVGSGLEEVLTDTLSGDILQIQVLPHFRAGDLPGGVVAGADALIEHLSFGRAPTP